MPALRSDGKPFHIRAKAPAKKPAKRRAPSKRTVAQSRSQAKTYRSQGRAVERVANEQRSTSRARSQERSYRSQGRAVERRAGTLNRETRRQQTSARRVEEVKRAARRVLRVSGSGDSRRGRRRAPGATVISTGEAIENRGLLGPLGRLPRAVGLALYEDPVGTSRETVKGGRDALLGAVPAALEAGATAIGGDPVGAVKGPLKDYLRDVSRRYGQLAEPGGVRKAADRIKKEGLAPEAFDALGLVAGPGGAVSRGISASARRGRLGVKAKRRVSEPRRRKRSAGGDAEDQRLSPGYFAAGRQKRRDERAYRGQERQIARADERARARRDDQGDRRGQVDALVRVATEAGQVVPSRLTVARAGKVGIRVARTPSTRKIRKGGHGGGGRVGYSARKSRGLVSQRAQQRAEGVVGAAGGAGGQFARLRRPEQRAYKYALELGVTTPAAGEQALRRHLADLPDGAPERPIIEKILSAPEKHFTGRLAAVVREESARGQRVAESDPRLGDTVGQRRETAEVRRRARQAALLGVERGGTPIRQAEATARARRDAARAELGKAQRRVELAERAVGRQGGRARLLVEQNAKKHLERVARADAAVAQHLHAARRWETKAGRARSPEAKLAYQAKGVAALERARKAHERAVDLQGGGPPPSLDFAPNSRPFRGGSGERLFSPGRGSIDKDGRLHTWYEGEGTHSDRGFGDQRKSADFMIRPDGTISVHAGGLGMDDTEIVARAIVQDPRLKPPASTRPDVGPIDGTGKRYPSLNDEIARVGAERRGGPVKARKAQARTEAAKGRLERERTGRAAIVGEVKAAAKQGRALAAARRRGVEMVDVEAVDSYLSRVIKTADLAGLEEPAYFKSAPRSASRFSAFTVGGSRATPRAKRDRGKLFAEGREAGDFGTYAQGLAEGIKAGHNWKLVTDTTADEALRDGAGKVYRGTPEELRKLGDELGFAPDSWTLWNPGVFREAGQAIESGGVTGRVGRGDAIFDAREDLAWEDMVAGEAAMSEAVRLGGDAGRFASSRDFVMMPKGVMDEILADTKPSGWFGRGLEVFKGTQARILLGTSPAWLQFQVASNMLLTTMAGVGPAEIVRMNRLWRRLPEEVKRELEPYVGVGHFHDSRDKAKIGAALNGGLFNAYRGFKAHPFWHKPRQTRLPGDRPVAISQLNPLDALFRVDNAQNNLFRRAVLLNRVKREAYARMGANVGVMQKAQDRLMGHLVPGRLPEEMIGRLVQDRKVVERHAEAVRDFLGDYQSYTARERRYLARSVMFYGFLRFSLRFAFYTMPVKHPLMTAIIGQLGQMQTEEVRKLLGGDELPWALGRLYFSKGGKLQSINVARANPFLNTLTEFNPDVGVLAQGRNLLRLLPPVYVAGLNQAFSKSSFRDRDFRVEGENRGRRSAEYGDTNRVRIIFNELARLNAIYRELDVASQGGISHGDDSILGDRPTEYRRADIVAGRRQDQQRFEDQGGALGSIKRGLLPLVPRDDISPEIAEKIRVSRGQQKKGGAPATPEQAAELGKLMKEAAAAGGASEGVDAEELRRLMREAELAGP